MGALEKQDGALWALTGFLAAPGVYDDPGGYNGADLSYAALERGDEAVALPAIYGSGFETRPCDAGGAARTRHVVRVTVAASGGRQRVDGGGGANRGRLHVLLHPRYPTCGSLVVVRMAYVDGSIPL